MPRYIGYTPQFNPISLQEYLAVPTMLQQEFDTYEEKYNENLDKLAALEGMLDESTKDYLNTYKGQLQNAADIISGKTGDLGTLRQQTSAARQFYREYAPKLTAAYTRRQEDLKAQRELELKDPSAITTKIGNMQSYLNDPDQRFYALSGDKIYSDMVNAGKLSAADLSKIENANLPGYLAKITGYTPQQQQEYSMLVQQALSGNKDADEALKNNPIYTQPYQVLSKYIEDNKFGVFDDSEKAYVLNRALSGQLMGMTGHTDYMADKQWEQNREDARQAKALAAKEKDEQPQIDLRQNRGTYINQYDANQDNALEKMSKTVDYKGKKINPIQAKHIINRLDSIIQNSENYQKLLTKRATFLVDHPEYRGKSPSRFNRQAPFNKQYFEIIDAISEFENRNDKNYVKTRTELSRLKNKVSEIKNTFSDILYSDKKIKEYGEQLGFNPNASEDEIYSNIRTNNRIYVGTNINASNAAGRTLKDDISGSLTQTISANPSHLKRTVKMIGSNSSEKLEDILVTSEDSSTGQKTYGGNDYHITLESIADESLATTGKQLKKNKNKNNIYLIPAQMFGSQAVSAIRNSLTQLNTDENGNEYIVGFNPSLKSHREALIDLYERNGLEEVMKNTVAASIHAAYGYNFFQNQPNTSTK